MGAILPRKNTPPPNWGKFRNCGILKVLQKGIINFFLKARQIFCRHNETAMRRVLLGDNTGSGLVMLRQIIFQFV